MKRVDVRLQRSPDEVMPVGRLASDGHTTVFEYADSFLRSGLPLSPFRLALEPGLHEYRDDRTFGPLPGVFNDSLPDGWGMLLMDRQLGQRGIDVRTVSPLDRLTYLGTRTMGALTYHPAEAADGRPQHIDLAELGKESAEILAGHADEVLPVLAAAGGSAGGARPKVVVGVRDVEIIAGHQDPAGRWRISPAYDLTYAAGPGGEHTLAVAGEGRDPRRADVLAVARNARIKDADALAVVDDVNAAIDRWDEIATSSGVSPRTRNEIAAAMRLL